MIAGLQVGLVFAEGAGGGGGNVDAISLGVGFDLRGGVAGAAGAQPEGGEDGVGHKIFGT